MDSTRSDIKYTDNIIFKKLSEYLANFYTII